MAYPTSVNSQITDVVEPVSHRKLIAILRGVKPDEAAGMGRALVDCRDHDDRSAAEFPRTA